MWKSFVTDAFHIAADYVLARPDCKVAQSLDSCARSTILHALGPRRGWPGSHKAERRQHQQAWFDTPPVCIVFNQGLAHAT